MRRPELSEFWKATMDMNGPILKLVVSRSVACSAGFAREAEKLEASHGGLEI